MSEFQDLYYSGIVVIAVGTWMLIGHHHRLRDRISR
jgi:hypothetical protein